jgi:hypothetical protein
MVPALVSRFTRQIAGILERGKGDTDIRPDGGGEPVGAKGGGERLPRPAPLGREQTLARQQKALLLICDGQRIAVHAMARLEASLEVRCPEVIRAMRGRRDHAGMERGAPPAPPLHNAPRFEEVTGNTGGGSCELALPPPEPVQQLARAPTRVAAPRGEQGMGHGRGQV